MQEGLWVAVGVCALGAVIILGVSGTLVLAATVFLLVIVLSVVIRHIVIVRRNQALVVCSRWDDRLVRVIHGPSWNLLIPGYEQEAARLDTTIQLQEVPLAELVQADQQPVILRFAVQVLYELVPKKLDLWQLTRVLPYLTDGVADIMQLWTDYLMRRLISSLDLTALNGHVLGRLERHLAQLLNEHLSILAVQVHSTKLVMQPPAGLYETLTAAEQQRVSIMLQEEQLNRLLPALKNQPEAARSLALLELFRSLGRSGQTWTALDVGNWLVGEEGNLPLTVGQLPWWPWPAWSTGQVSQRARLTAGTKS